MCLFGGTGAGGATIVEMLFLCRWSFTLPKNLSGQKIFCSLSWFSVLIENYSIFPSIFFLFTFFRSSIGNPSFPFLSFFSFLPFRSLIGNSDFSIHYSLSLEEILLSFSSGGRMRILFMGQGSR